MSQKSGYQEDKREDIAMKMPAENGREGKKEPRKRDKERIQLDFSPEALERLDQIKEITNASTRAETIRQALRLYEWFVTELRPTDLITVTDENKEIVQKLSVRLIRGSLE